MAPLLKDVNIIQQLQLVALVLKEWWWCAASSAGAAAINDRGVRTCSVLVTVITNAVSRKSAGPRQEEFPRVLAYRRQPDSDQSPVSTAFVPG